MDSNPQSPNINPLNPNSEPQPQGEPSPVAQPDISPASLPPSNPEVVTSPVATPVPTAISSPNELTNQAPEPTVVTSDLINPVVVTGGEPVVSPIVVDQPVASSQLPQPASTKKKWYRKKSVLVLSLVIVLLLGGSAYAYFGYFMNPNVIWSESLSDMNIGYNQLVGYANSQSKIKYNGIKETGSFNVKDGGSSYSGSLNTQSYGDNSTLSAKVNLGVTNIDVEERSIAVSGSNEPDVYIQISGIKNYLNEILGSSSYSSIDGQWFSIDHSLLNGLVPKNNNKATLTWQEVNSYLQSVGKVDKQYVFTTNPKYSVTKVIKKYGFQTINGQKTYHYKVGFIPANVKSYIKAMCSAFGSSALESYAKQRLGSSFDYLSSCTSLEASTSSITPKDTIDVWADVNTRYIYQVRVSDPSNPTLNYVDLGLKYKPGASSYPFFVAGQDKSGGSNVSYLLSLVLNTKTNNFTVNLNANDGSGSSNAIITGNFNVGLNNTPLNVTAPAGAIPLTTELNNLGLGQYVSQLQSLSTNSQSVL